MLLPTLARLMPCVALLFFSLQAHAEESLYIRLGGEAVVTRVVEQAIARIAEDPRVNQSFNKVNLKKLDDSIVVQICSLTGGGCVYKGDDMKRAHGGQNITEAEFYALVDAMRDALDTNNVGEREKNELLKILAPMKRSVVTR